MILVSGSTGLVGAHLLFSLSAQGEKLRALYRSEKNKKPVLDLFKNKSPEGETWYESIEWVQADILDIPALEKAFVGVTKLYHCAAFISFDPNDYKKLKKINVQGTANMVNLSLHFGIEKMCYVSSIAALGKASPSQLITEDTDWNIENPNVYAMSKYEAELEVWRGIQEGLSAVIVNPGVILGPGFWDRGAAKLFHFASKRLPLYFPGGSGFVGVQQVIESMLLAMKSPYSGERYICVSENISYQELFAHMAKSFSKKPPTIKIPFLALSLLWRLDALKHFFFKGSRRITKQTVAGLKTIDVYDSSKSVRDLGVLYSPISEVVRACCSDYLKRK